LTSYLFIYSAVAFTISVLIFPVLIKLLTQWKLFDSPGRHKIHVDFTPSMGGIPIFMGVIFTLLIGLSFMEWADLKFFFIALALIFVTGLRDDILTLTPTQKLIGQFLPIIIVVVFGATTLNSFYGIISTDNFPTYVAWAVSIFAIIIFTNAYNLIDGLDGLAGTVGLIVLICFGSWFFVTDNYPLSLISFAFAASILGFLVFNWQPSKIFMGDTGALSIGFLLSFLAIQFVNANYAIPQEHPARFHASIGTVICVLIIPIFDTLRVIILRLRKLESPFHADKNHFHHQFINLGFSHQKAVLVMGSINLAFVGLAYILRNQNDRVILPLVIIICLGINQGLKVAQQRQHGT
jgi:UDP-GlcNAc:undecaprenyl-phosphate GlcNAc-1-phosphate transferase